MQSNEVVKPRPKIDAKRDTVKVNLKPGSEVSAEIIPVKLGGNLSVRSITSEPKLNQNTNTQQGCGTCNTCYDCNSNYCTTRGGNTCQHTCQGTCSCR